MNKKIHEWVDKSITQIVRGHSNRVSEYIDILLGYEVENKAEVLKVAVDLYLIAVKAVVDRSVDSEIMAELLIPFNWADGIILFDGNYYFNLFDDLPSLVLTSRSVFKEKRSGDIYKKSVAPFDERLEEDNFETIYWCGFYDGWARRYDQDYLRYLIVQHYSDDLVASPTIAAQPQKKRVEDYTLREVLNELRSRPGAISATRSAVSEKTFNEYAAKHSLCLHDDYRELVIHASDVDFHGKRLLDITKDGNGDKELFKIYKMIQDQGSPKDWIPFFEDYDEEFGTDYTCLDSEGRVQIWSVDEDRRGYRCPNVIHVIKNWWICQW